MEAFFEWINTHGMALIAALVGLFVVVAKITPTPKDDAWAAKLMSMLNILPAGAKETLKEEEAAKKA